MSIGQDGLNRRARAVFETVRYASEQEFLITRTKLMKLLYLADLRAVDKGQMVRSEANWVWHNYGPFDQALLTVEDDLVSARKIERTELTTHVGSSYKKLEAIGGVEYEALEGQSEWNCKFFEILHEVIDDYGALSAKQLTQLAYRTPPMKLAQEDNGERGVALDISMGSRPSKKVSRRNLARLRSLRGRREKIRRQSDEGDLNFLEKEVLETANSRSRASRKLLK